MSVNGATKKGRPKNSPSRQKTGSRKSQKCTKPYETETSKNNQSILNFFPRKPVAKTAHKTEDAFSSIVEFCKADTDEEMDVTSADTDDRQATSSRPMELDDADSASGTAHKAEDTGHDKHELSKSELKEQCDGDIPLTEEKEDHLSIGENGNRAESETKDGKGDDNDIDLEKNDRPPDDDGDHDGTEEYDDDGDHDGTEEYELFSTEDVRNLVHYEDEDFNTDTDFDELDVGTEVERPDQKEGKYSGSVSNSRNRKKSSNKAVGSKGKSSINPTRTTFSTRKEACQGSSSEDESERPLRPRRRTAKGFSEPSGLPSLKRKWSDLDTEQYRAGYPGKPDKKNATLNLQFYTGKIKSTPNGAFIDTIHKHWWNDYDQLECHHGFIQWLFPIRESGMNYQAQELQLHEAEFIKKDKRAMERFVNSYKMMLNFYGIDLVSTDTGEVKRASNWQPRFKHLNSSMHNYLRITRILKSLGEMGLEHFKAPFIHFMLKEACETQKLDRTLDSCCNYWIGTLKVDEERKLTYDLAEKLVETTRRRR